MKSAGLYFIIAVAFLLITTSLLIVEGGPHSFITNAVLINFTFVGDGILISSLILLLIYRKGWVKVKSLLLAFLLTGVIIQVIKNFILNDGIHIFFEEGEYIFTSGKLNDLAGMPSSHMAFATALLTLIAFYLSQWKWTVVIIAGALLLGYSRIYLSGNNITDLLIGGVTGLLSSLLSYTAFFPAGKQKLVTGKFAQEQPRPVNDLFPG